MSSVVSSVAVLLAVLLTALVLVSLEPRASCAQSRRAFFNTPSELRRVGGESSVGERVPAVVILAPTNGTAADLFARLQDAIPLPHYVAVLTPGRPTRADYLPRFGSYVEWMIERVEADLERARAEHGVDPQRVYLTGFSLGGDTSWALLVRRPDLFRGAVVLGARSSARARSRAVRELRSRRARVAFGIGQDDTEVRVRGIERAYAAMQGARIPSRLQRYPGTHTLPEDRAVLDALYRFVMLSEEP